MAKQKLFGNRKDPRCETCAHGKRGPDGQSVLCNRSGAVPLHHHCRRYVYDPLRRIPKRDPILQTFDESDFMLDDIAETIEPAATADAEAVDRLRDYLKNTKDPDAETILALLDRLDGKSNTDAASSEEGETESPTSSEENKVPTADILLEDIPAEALELLAEEVPSVLAPETTATETTDPVTDDIAQTTVAPAIRFPKKEALSPEEQAATLLEPIENFEELEPSAVTAAPATPYVKKQAISPEEQAASLLEPVENFEELEPSEVSVAPSPASSPKAVISPEEAALAVFKEEIAALEKELLPTADNNAVVQEGVPVAAFVPQPGVTYIPVQPGVTYVPVNAAQVVPVQEASASEEPAVYTPSPEDLQVFAEIDKAIGSEESGVADNSPNIFGDLERLDIDKAAPFHSAFRDPSLNLSVLSAEAPKESSHDPQFDELARRLDATSTVSLPDDDFDDGFDFNEKDIVLLSSSQLKDESIEELAMDSDGNIRVVQPNTDSKKKKKKKK